MGCSSATNVSFYYRYKVPYFVGYEVHYRWETEYGEKVGGLIGEASGATVSSCYSTGSVVGKRYVGGLIGYNSNSTVSNCYRQGNVTGKYSSYGAFVGYNYNSVIENSYSRGTCTYNSSPAPAFIGGVSNSTTRNNFFDSQTSQQSSATGATAKNTTEMKDIATYTSLFTVGLDSAWDFLGNPNDDNKNESFWDMNASVNNGYPFLISSHKTTGYEGPDNGSSLSLYVPGATSQAVVNFINQKPQASSLPTGIHRIFPFHWQISAPQGDFPHAIISMPVSGLSGIADTSALVWLKRANSGESWTNIGGSYVNGILTSDPFSSFSEFTIGTSDVDSALPVTLASFTAEALNGAVHVSWVTESETENLAFRIYRGGEMIAELDGAGTTSEPQNYIYTDQYVIPGRTYTYVLADVDLQSKETKHPELKVEVKVEMAGDMDFNIGSAYPNPFNPQTIVPLNLAKDADVRAFLYDLSGRMIRKLFNASLQPGSHDLKIDGSDLSTGIYLLQIRINDAVYVQKIALMK
ncbi:MAG: T9SS type A sorting domain-containing protein [Candidatus Marinimicrobia bacterium]|nr:T9SS type A sorting domain-containing protein [Candidatus Neomarinimicrobiota bacterium]